MSQYLNQAALDYWKDVDKRVDKPLRDVVRKSLGTDKYVDIWIKQMIKNNLEANED